MYMYYMYIICLCLSTVYLNHVKNVRDRDIYRYIYIHTQSGNDFNFLCISQKENKHDKYLKISVTATNL